MKYEDTCATAKLDMKYIVAITTLCMVLCRAEVGRDDGVGGIYAEGRGAFVVRREQRGAARL